jgi:pimeloyl-ACP methyl ester carboxylesterase
MPFAHNGSLDIYYETLGDAADPGLLMVSGLGRQLTDFPSGLCDRLVAHGFHLIRFDNRDAGLSTSFDHVTPDWAGVLKALRDGKDPTVAYRLPDMATDAVAVLDDLGIERAHVAGVSMGGMIVQQLALDHPDRLLSMTSIMSTTGDRDVGQPSPEAFAILTGPPPTDLASSIARRQEGLLVFGSPGHYDANAAAEAAEEAYERSFNPAGTARQLIGITASGSRAEALRQVEVAALVMHGDADKLVDISGGRRTAACIPGARFEVLEGMGHDCPPAYWDRWAELISDHTRAAVPD